MNNETTNNSGYVPLWVYQASGVNFTYRNGYWKKENNETTFDFYCVPEGVKMNLITSMAATIEGALRIYLKEKLVGKNINYKMKSTKNNLNLTASYASWSSLVKWHDEIFEDEMKLNEKLNKTCSDLYRNIEILFLFRNFITHSNYLEIEYAKLEANDIDKAEFIGKEKEKLIQFLRDKGFYNEEEVIFIKLFIPDDLIVFFKQKCFDCFLQSDLFKADNSKSKFLEYYYNIDHELQNENKHDKIETMGNFKLQNLIKLIWKK